MSLKHSVPVTFQDPSEDKSTVEFELLKIFVNVGDLVSEKDVLAEIESDKGVGDVASPVSGEILEIKLESGKRYKYADVLCVIEEK